jgi:hypothetical protein
MCDMAMGGKGKGKGKEGKNKEQGRGKRKGPPAVLLLGHWLWLLAVECGC